MARGQQKIQSQQRNAEKKAKAAKGKSGNLKAQAAAQTIKCNVCMQTFMCTTKLPELKLHHENKHDKKTFQDCFPDQA